MIVALLPPAVPVVLKLHGDYRTVALIWGALAIAALGASVLTAVGVMQTRNSQGVNISTVRQAWRECCERTQSPYVASDTWHATQAQRDLTEMLLHANSDVPSPVQSMSEDADRRGGWLSWCVRFNVLGLVSILALTITVTWGSL